MEERRGFFKDPRTSTRCMRRVRGSKRWRRWKMLLPEWLLMINQQTSSRRLFDRLPWLSSFFCNWTTNQRTRAKSFSLLRQNSSKRLPNLFSGHFIPHLKPALCEWILKKNEEEPTTSTRKQPHDQKKKVHEEDSSLLVVLHCWRILLNRTHNDTSSYLFDKSAHFTSISYSIKYTDDNNWFLDFRFWGSVFFKIDVDKNTKPSISAYTQK